MNEQQDISGHWDRGWEEHKNRQLLRMARLPLAVKLEWLEEAQALADALTRRAARKANRGVHTASSGE